MEACGADIAIGREWPIHPDSRRLIKDLPRQPISGPFALPVVAPRRSSKSEYWHGFPIDNNHALPDANRASTPMETRNLRSFLALAEIENFTRAAKKMHMSQSTLSHQIKELELQVGVPLFERLGRKVRLTRAGTVLRDHASRAIRVLDDALPAIAEVDSLSRGRVAVGVVQVLDHLLVPRVISIFTGSHPGIGIRVDRLWQLDIEAAVRCGDLDLGIGLDPPRTPGVEFEPLFKTDFALIVPGGHHLAGRRSLTLAELGRESLILIPRKGSWLRMFTDGAFAAEKVEPRSSIELDSVEAILAATRQGVGVAFLPVAVLGRGRPGLESVAIEGVMTEIAVGLLWGKGINRSRAATAFAETTARVVRGEGLTPLG
jgi:LysR family cyn operon transcriptional activator